MKALAWDDRPKLYMEELKRELSGFGIELHIETDPGGFLKAHKSGEWHFVITDLYHDDHPAPGELDPTHGQRIAQSLSHELPVFVVTQHFERMTSDKLGLPGNVVIKSKSTHPAWMAGEIVDELKRQGIFFNPRQVFLIYGQDRGWPGLRDKVRGFLKGLSLDVAEVSGANLRTEIVTGLLEKMNECAAFIALCTPDDHVSSPSDQYQPRQNVLLEIGMVLGLTRGLDRLTILQGWRTVVDKQARLPSDMGGIVTIQLEDDFVEQYRDILGARLLELGVQVSKPDQE